MGIRIRIRINEQVKLLLKAFNITGQWLSESANMPMLKSNQRAWGATGRGEGGQCGVVNSGLGELRVTNCANLHQPLCMLPAFSTATQHLSSQCPEGFIASPVDDRCFKTLETGAISLQAAMTECSKSDAVVASGGSFAETLWLVERFGGQNTPQQAAGMWVNWRRTKSDPTVFSRSWGVYSDPPVMSSINSGDTLRFPLDASGAEISPWATGQPNNYNSFEPDDCAVLAGSINGGLIGARSVDCLSHTALPLCMWDKRIVNGPSQSDSAAAGRDSLVSQLPFPALCPKGFQMSTSSGACIRIAQGQDGLSQPAAQQVCKHLRPDAVLLPWAAHDNELEFISSKLLEEVSVFSAWTGVVAAGEHRSWPFGGNTQNSALAPNDAAQIWNGGASAHSIRGPSIAMSSAGIILARGGMALGRDPAKAADSALCAVYPGCPLGSFRHPIQGLCFSIEHMSGPPESSFLAVIAENAATVCAKGETVQGESEEPMR